jgi:methylase of polypeptide subunit release factors
MTSPFLMADRPDDIARVRDSLDQAGYTVEEVRRAIGENGFTFLGRGEMAPVLRRTQGGSPIETLIRLFLCGVEVDLASARRALAPLPPERWAAAGLVALGPSGVTGLIKLRPYEVIDRRWIVAYDSDSGRRQHATDYVIGVGAASLTMASMTVRPHVGRCLDLGTGGGIQALHASEHADAVVATDRNPRAVAFAAFTMALNNIANVTTRQGDLFEPVAGERFGLIVSNPPFVISPEDRFDYRDSGLPVDGICRRIVEQAPLHLEEGGWCQLLANWAHLGQGDWRARLAGWFEGTGCDAWVIQRDVEDVERYASTWIRHEEPNPAQTGEAFNAWMDFYQRSDITAVGVGLITMRRSTSRSNWLRIDELTQDLAVPCGDAIRAAFDRLAWLAATSDDDGPLLDARLRVADDVGLHERRVVSDGRWAVAEAELRLATGLRHLGSIDPQGAGVVAGCDGRNRLGELLQRLADSIGADVADVVPQALPIVRRLVEQGFLLPEGPEAAATSPGWRPPG